MFCPNCKNEMFLDRIEPETGKLYYVCVNPRCSSKGKAIALTGEETEATVTVNTSPLIGDAIKE